MILLPGRCHPRVLGAGAAQRGVLLVVFGLAWCGRWLQEPGSGRQEGERWAAALKPNGADIRE